MQLSGLFDGIPVLESDRLILRQLTDAYADALRLMTQNPRIYRYLPTFLIELRVSDPHEMIRRLYGECFLNRKNLILGIFLKNEMQFCGLAELYGYKETLQKTCIGYRLAEEYWGRGIASETVRIMVEYLYHETDIRIIAASTMVENHASEHVLEKSGFRCTAHAVPEDWGYEKPTAADKWLKVLIPQQILESSATF